MIGKARNTSQPTLNSHPSCCHGPRLGAADLPIACERQPSPNSVTRGTEIPGLQIAVKLCPECEASRLSGETRAPRRILGSVRNRGRDWFDEGTCGPQRRSALHRLPPPHPRRLGHHHRRHRHHRNLLAHPTTLGRHRPGHRHAPATPASPSLERSTLRRGSGPSRCATRSGFGCPVSARRRRTARGPRAAPGGLPTRTVRRPRRSRRRQRAPLPIVRAPGRT